MTETVLTQDALVVAKLVKCSITTRGITVDSGHVGPNNTTGSIVALRTGCWWWRGHDPVV
jgi:hypothetical protein